MNINEQELRDFLRHEAQSLSVHEPPSPIDIEQEPRDVRGPRRATTLVLAAAAVTSVALGASYLTRAQSTEVVAPQDSPQATAPESPNGSTSGGSFTGFTASATGDGLGWKFTMSPPSTAESAPWLKLASEGWSPQEVSTRTGERGTGKPLADLAVATDNSDNPSKFIVTSVFAATQAAIGRIDHTISIDGQEVAIKLRTGNAVQLAMQREGRVFHTRAYGLSDQEAATVLASISQQQTGWAYQNLLGLGAVGVATPDRQTAHVSSYSVTSDEPAITRLTKQFRDIESLAATDKPTATKQLTTLVASGTEATRDVGFAAISMNTAGSYEFWAKLATSATSGEMTLAAATIDFGFGPRNTSVVLSNYDDAKPPAHGGQGRFLQRLDNDQTLEVEFVGVAATNQQMISMVEGLKFSAVPPAGVAEFAQQAKVSSQRLSILRDSLYAAVEAAKSACGLADAPPAPNQRVGLEDPKVQPINGEPLPPGTTVPLPPGTTVPASEAPTTSVG